MTPVETLNAVGVIVAVLTALGTLATLIWHGGRVMQRIDDHAKDIDEHKGRLDQHGVELVRGAERFSVVETKLDALIKQGERMLAKLDKDSQH
ncbi:MAG: hypothetical protein GC155_06300 [Alphaproteobacteria bacterium]|nr:hypothetical protein [Alphaproteobacteria bacterium]